MNYLQTLDSPSSPKKTVSEKCLPKINKRVLSDSNFNYSKLPPKKAITDNFASSTPLKKTKNVFLEASELDLQLSSKMKTVKQTKFEHKNEAPFENTNNVQSDNVKPSSHISGESFKDIIYNLYFDDFCKPYKKLNCKPLPDCCDSGTCDKKHKNIQRKEICTYSNGTLFNILDNPLTNWLYDISTAAFSVLRPELFFSSEVLRIFFDYILNGPEENLVWDVKHIVASHLELHPPCTEPMRQFYESLLSQAYKKDPNFKTNLNNIGVLNHIINQLEESIESTKPFTQEDESVHNQEEIADIKTKKDVDMMEEITFEVLEQRWNNFQPLLDDEYNEVVDALDDLGKSILDIDEGVNIKGKIMPRLAIALELVVDILETDFLICISKLKKYISSDSSRCVEPIIKHFVDENLHERVFILYVRVTYEALWIQLSRLISLMAEYEHLFKPFPQRLWQYPNLHPQCERFSTSFCNSLDKCDWDEEERLFRLQMLHPPWLRLQIAMHWVNSDLKLALGSDLKAVVDTIHMHIISPVKLERDSRLKVNDIAVSDNSPEFIKKATKRNKYGEMMLHIACKAKKYSKSRFFNLLSLPAVDVNAKDYFGWTPLHEAVLSNSVFKTKILLQYQPPHGALPVDTGAQNSEGSTPLHEAVIAKNLEICKLLVEYGGACLLRKTNCEGVTPLELAKGDVEIKKYFDRVIKTQELLNLSPSSELNMPEFIVQLLVVACNAFLDDHHTWQVYCETRMNQTPRKVHPKKWIVISKTTLVKFKQDQDVFRKLRKILNKLSENPKNTSLVKLWDSKFQSACVY